MTHCFYRMDGFPVVKDPLSRSFEKVGYKVLWQKLAEDFQDETFRFQVLDEGEYTDRERNWGQRTIFLTGSRAV